MNRAPLILAAALLAAGCIGSHYHYKGQYIVAYPVQIACSNCHRDYRARFNHGRGWSDQHYSARRYNGDVCSACHGDVLCDHCHTDPGSHESVWSQIKQDRWKKRSRE